MCLGYGHSTIVYTKGGKVVYACGWNKYGELGLGNEFCEWNVLT